MDDGKREVDQIQVFSTHASPTAGSWNGTALKKCGADVLMNLSSADSIRQQSRSTAESGLSPLRSSASFSHAGLSSLDADIYAFEIDTAQALPFSADEFDLDGGPSQKSVLSLDGGSGTMCLSTDSRSKSARIRPKLRKTLTKNTHQLIDAHRIIGVQITLGSGKKIAESSFTVSSTMLQVKRWLERCDGVRTPAKRLTLMSNGDVASDDSRLKDILAALPESAQELVFQVVKGKSEEFGKERRDTASSFQKFLEGSDTDDGE